MKLRLGTRKSLLAWAQSSLVAEALEEAQPGLKVELTGIVTRGDKILDVSLRQIEGKEFFVKELDEALLSGAVDFTVHSLKDLSLERPTGLRHAATGARENPRDLVIFNRHVVEKLRAGRPIRIGTSSPRRIENIPAFLEKALPRFHEDQIPDLKFLEIRGNVNTRLERIHKNENEPEYLDAVVLAFAGIARLWKHPSSHEALKRLLGNVRFMLLPLAECPAAPAQGALSIECRADDDQTFKILQHLHCTVTDKHIRRERHLLKLWGGGCHQRFGATAVHHEEVGELFYIRGAKPDGEFIEGLEWAPPSSQKKPKAKEAIWDGTFHRAKIDSLVGDDGGAPSLGPACFVANARALPRAWEAGCQAADCPTRFWTSGAKSWFGLAKRGLWVEGSAEGLGFEFIAKTLGEGCLSLPASSEWRVLTHHSAANTWQSGMILPTYKVQHQLAEKALADLRQARHVFWSSASQFEALHHHARQDVWHACGPGKTATKLRALGAASLNVFPSVEQWRGWINHD